MRNLTWALIGLAAVGFVIAVGEVLLGRTIMDVGAEGFSRGSTNLSLIAIALMLVSEKKGAGA